MATAGERLRLLAGTSGAAGALLLAIGSGATAGAALVEYSGLESATAAQHLLADNSNPVQQDAVGAVVYVPINLIDDIELEDEEAVLLLAAQMVTRYA